MPGHDRPSSDDTPPLSSEELLQRARDGLFDDDLAEKSGEHVRDSAATEPVVDEGRTFHDAEADDPGDTDGPIEPVFVEGSRTYDDADEAEAVAAVEIPPDVFGTTLPPDSEGSFETGRAAPDDRPVTVTDRMGTPADAPPAPSLWARAWALRGILVGLVVLGIVVFNFFDSSTDVESLLIGDCFDEPSGDEFSSVDVVDCAEPHDYEVFATVDIPGDTYPGDFDVFIDAFEECEFFFTAFVGTDYATSEIYLAPFVPTESSWDAGDREAICAIYLPTPDGEGVARTTGSLQGSGR